MSYMLFLQNCDPSRGSSPHAPLKVYRLVKDKSNITQKDFEPHILRNPHITYPDKCIASGVSVFRDIQKIKKIKQKFPNLNKYHIASGNIFPHDGLISSSQNGHITWWTSKKNAHTNFKAVP